MGRLFVFFILTMTFSGCCNSRSSFDFGGQGEVINLHVKCDSDVLNKLAKGNNVFISGLNLGMIFATVSAIERGDPLMGRANFENSEIKTDMVFDGWNSILLTGLSDIEASKWRWRFSLYGGRWCNNTQGLEEFYRWKPLLKLRDMQGVQEKNTGVSCVIIPATGELKIK